MRLSGERTADFLRCSENWLVEERAEREECLQVFIEFRGGSYMRVSAHLRVYVSGTSHWQQRSQQPVFHISCLRCRAEREEKVLKDITRQTVFENGVISFNTLILKKSKNTKVDFLNQNLCITKDKEFLRPKLWISQLLQKMLIMVHVFLNVLVLKIN